jgi:hypothetical protein
MNSSSRSRLVSPLVAAVLASAALGGQHKAARDAIFLTNFETVSLPAMVIASANTHAWESRRLLDAHVFTPLALVLPTEPLRIAFRGWHTDDPALRGTALEYLENVLPHQIRDRLWPKRRAATAPRNMG